MCTITAQTAEPVADQVSYLLPSETTVAQRSGAFALGSFRARHVSTSKGVLVNLLVMITGDKSTIVISVL